MVTIKLFRFLELPREDIILKKNHIEVSKLKIAILRRNGTNSQKMIIILLITITINNVSPKMIHITQLNFNHMKLTSPQGLIAFTKTCNLIGD